MRGNQGSWRILLSSSILWVCFQVWPTATISLVTWHYSQAHINPKNINWFNNFPKYFFWGYSCSNASDTWHQVVHNFFPKFEAKHQMRLPSFAVGLLMFSNWNYELNYDVLSGEWPVPSVVFRTIQHYSSARSTMNGFLLFLLEVWEFVCVLCKS